MLEKAKSFLALIAGWLATIAIAVFWFTSRRRSPATTVRVEPKKVPETDEEVLEEARKEGIIR